MPTSEREWRAERRLFSIPFLNFRPNGSDYIVPGYLFFNIFFFTARNFMKSIDRMTG